MVCGSEAHQAAILKTLTDGDSLLALSKHKYASNVVESVLMHGGTHAREVILEEMLRVANQALVVVPNFGHWRVRVNQFIWGRAPVSSSERYQWYNTPNLHLMSMPDFRDLVEVVNGHIVKELAIINDRAVENAWAANIRANSAVYILKRNS